MRTSSSLASYVIESLGFLGPLANRSIFGVEGIYLEDRLLAIVANDTLYLHTGPGNRDDYLARGCAQFKPFPNAYDLTTDHHRVPDEVVADPEKLKEWGRRALEASVEAARMKKLAGIERSREAKKKAKKKT